MQGNAGSGFWILESLTGDRLSQDELHLLPATLVGVLNEFVNPVSSRIESGRTASFRQGDLPPTLHHHCILWKVERKLAILFLFFF